MRNGLLIALGEQKIEDFFIQANATYDPEQEQEQLQYEALLAKQQA